MRIIEEGELQWCDAWVDTKAYLPPPKTRVLTWGPTRGLTVGAWQAAHSGDASNPIVVWSDGIEPVERSWNDNFPVTYWRYVRPPKQESRDANQIQGIPY